MYVDANHYERPNMHKYLKAALLAALLSSCGGSLVKDSEPAPARAAADRRITASASDIETAQGFWRTLNSRERALLCKAYLEAPAWRKANFIENWTEDGTSLREAEEVWAANVVVYDAEC